MAVSPKRTALSGTELMHADDQHNVHSEVAPSISVTTTFRAPHPDSVKTHEIDWQNPERHLYSRYTQSNSTRAEKVLSKINGGHAITYASGLAAAYAALVFYNPKRVAITNGYHGCHMTIEVIKQLRPDLKVIDLDQPYQEGDLCWLETPLNPTGEVRDIKYYADKIHSVGGNLVIDATFAPPPLQYPFKWGADCVMHSGTKYFGGHSDLLAGVLVVQTQEEWNKLWSNRTYMGNMIGSFEAWLLLRSLRTLHLRVPRQSETATALAQWLAKIAAAKPGTLVDGVPGGIIETVWHSSLQGKNERGWDPKDQMEGGWNATFSIFMKDTRHAELLPHALKYFVPATSLGGVESLIEQRRQSDPGADPRLIRISVGIEDLSDLKDDMRRALQGLVNEKAKL
ncbi:cystathionine gamma-synthase [Punctularia strigosozonata HHB-11173 SS5]|uniref:cystathionine gamma-synthase n=1 Tax=Punctularia strigosozonata (strain HHB-11173) TaxID=741275 RepID=UPI00044163E6|nr:cystathionine gamma-synthase [Punctularia strigosozonata HHB-11173 SS5]EIN10726.1 cystathionine gamma-synthase [Punctularia strigosozonata HHB-11173 SS5]